jgi:hypothetical protein
LPTVFAVLESIRRPIGPSAAAHAVNGEHPNP